jgi:cytochrome c-type biogenesis protein CcmF
LGLLLGLSLLVQWKEESSGQLLRSSAFSLVASAAVLILLVVFGLNDVLFGAFAFSSLFAFFVNVLRLYRLSKQSLRYTGGALSHIGLAFLFLGIIGSGRYGEKKTASLPLNEPREVLGHQLTYTGYQPTQDGKWEFSVKVVSGSSQYVLDPVMFQSEYTNSLMRNPDYASSLTSDFYIEPVSLEEVAQTPEASGSMLLQLKKGESKTVGDATVTFVQFDTNHKGTESMVGGGAFAVGAVLEVKRGTSTERVVPVTLYKGSQTPQPQVARTKDGKLGFELLSMNVDSQAKGSTIELSVTGLGAGAPATQQKSELLVIEASVKPFVSLVWAGAFLIIVGLGISLVNKLNGNVSSPANAAGRNSGVSGGQPQEEREGSGAGGQTRQP